jgi:hypothetical protein
MCKLVIEIFKLPTIVAIREPNQVFEFDAYKSGKQVITSNVMSPPPTTKIDQLGVHYLQ